MRRLVLAGGLVAVLVVCRYLSNGLLAERNAVRIRVIKTTAAPVPAGRIDRTLKLAAFNIAHGRGTNASNWSRRAERQDRLRQIAGLLVDQQVDIAVLNEVDFDAVWTGYENQAEIIARAAGFQYVVEQRNLDVAIPFLRLRFGNAVLSRFPVESAQLVRLPAYSERERGLAGAKQGMRADIRLDDRRVIRLFPVHWEHRDGATRVRSAEVIAACVKDSPFPCFCLGDFNDCPSLFVEAPTTNKNRAVDVLLGGGRLKTIPAARMTPDQLTFSSYAPVIAIDWILIPPDWEFASHRVLDLRLSDHRPVFAELSPPGRGVN
jgi:endonuclease/exonuclease/phosphatase family metal-dependent hydrolase